MRGHGATTGSATSLVDALFARPQEQGRSLALLAVRGGDVVVERYGVQPANEFQAEVVVDESSTLLSWSMAKSMTHAAVGLLAGDGVLDPAAPAAVPEWASPDDPRASITLDQLLAMRSGLRFVEDYVDGDVSHCIEMLFGGTDPSFARYAASLPLDHEPGAVFNYSSGTTNIVARVVGDAVHGPGGDPAERRRAVETFLRTRLFEPAGMTSATPGFDDAGDFVGSSYVYANARDFARFGELYLRDGFGVDGTRILPDGWCHHGTAPVSQDPESGFGYGRHWWHWPAFPGSFAAHGYEGQFTLVVPDRDLVIVHLGKTPAAFNPPLAMWIARLVQSLG